MFYILTQQYFLWISFFSFEGVQHFWLELCTFCSKFLPATSQRLFCVTKSDIEQGPSNHTAPFYELLVSVLRLTLSFGEVSTYCRHTYIRQKFSFFKIIFTALTDRQNNFNEINRLFKLVVSRMFLLPCSVSLMCFFFILVSFLGRPL